MACVYDIGMYVLACIYDIGMYVLACIYDIGPGVYGIYVPRKVRIGTIPELSCAKWEFSLCPPIPELYWTILELRKGYMLKIDKVYVPVQSGNSWTK